MPRRGRPPPARGVAAAGAGRERRAHRGAGRRSRPGRRARAVAQRPRHGPPRRVAAARPCRAPGLGEHGRSGLPAPRALRHGHLRHRPRRPGHRRRGAGPRGRRRRPGRQRRRVFTRPAGGFGGAAAQLPRARPRYGPRRGQDARRGRRRYYSSIDRPSKKVRARDETAGSSAAGSIDDTSRAPARSTVSQRSTGARRSTGAPRSTGSPHRRLASSSAAAEPTVTAPRSSGRSGSTRSMRTQRHPRSRRGAWPPRRAAYRSCARRHVVRVDLPPAPATWSGARSSVARPRAMSRSATSRRMAWSTPMRDRCPRPQSRVGELGDLSQCEDPRLGARDTPDDRAPHRTVRSQHQVRPLDVRRLEGASDVVAQPQLHLGPGRACEAIAPHAAREQRRRCRCCGP